MTDDAPMFPADDAEQTGPEAGQVPVRVPAPAPVPASGPSSLPDDAPDGEGGEGATGPLSAAEEAALGRLMARRDQAAADASPRLKVEAPHAAFTYGGFTVGSDFTSVPATARPALLTAALEAGVTLTQEE